jgi:Sulfotransferase family
MLFGSRVSNIPGLAPPPVLIFFHIPKTGGITMKNVFMNCLPGQYFDCDLGAPVTALSVRSTARVAEKFHQLPVGRQRAVRCMVGEHISMDVAAIFDRPSKFFTIVREPVDRVISNFFFNRTLTYLPCYPFIKDLTLEEYLDSGIGLDHNNHQVRMLSGCPELDVPWDPEGRRISTPPVERRHLDMAKRNIEERFIVAAPMEKYAALVWFLKRLYGWPTHRIFFQVRNQTPNRPSLDAVSETTRKRLETLNQYDIELYEWVKDRFIKQIDPLEPNFSREVRRFDMLNRCFRQIRRATPQPIPAMVRHLRRLLLSQAMQH